MTATQLNERLAIPVGVGRSVSGPPLHQNLLVEVDRWRTILATNIAMRNPSLAEQDIEFAASRTIQQVVFLALCERRGIHDFGNLRAIRARRGLYETLRKTCRRVHDQYVVSLLDSPSIHVDDTILLDILSSPLPAADESTSDVLGHVHEHLLSSRVRLGKDRNIRIEEAPGTRKTGGVYYTPLRVVDHIVRTTLGALTNDRSLDDVCALRVLDPACGSGAFLIHAFSYLIDWQRAHYVASDPRRWSRGPTPALRRDRSGEWQLSRGKRVQILLDQLFGVDIDSRALEVTALSLLLNVLEGPVAENDATYPLPLCDIPPVDLAGNLKCGDSLVGPEYAPSPHGVVPDPTRTLDWPLAFESTFQAGGFDVVIGNPPYLSYGGRQAVELPESLRDYFSRSYDSAGWPTAHSMFIERSVKLLSRNLVSFIVPDQVGHLEGYRSIREVVGRNSSIVEVRYWGESVFEGVTCPALTFVAQRGHQGDSRVVEDTGEAHCIRLAPGDIWGASPSRDLLSKLAERSLCIRPFIADCGIRTTCAKKQVVSVTDARPEDLPVLEGKQVGRYVCAAPKVAVRFDTGHAAFRSREQKYVDARFVIRQTAAYPIVGPREHVSHFRNSLLALYAPSNGLDICYLVGLLNSKLIRFAYVETTREARQRTFPQVKLGALSALPIRSIDFGMPAERALHNRIVSLVDLLVASRRNTPSCESPRERAKTAEELDRSLDSAIYGLYDLTSAEIATVERVVAGLPAPP